MAKIYIDTPLGSTEIIGDSEGVSSVKVLDEKKSPSEKIPDLLQNHS